MGELAPGPRGPPYRGPLRGHERRQDAAQTPGGALRRTTGG